MEMLGKIRRMYFRDKLSLHQIAKRIGLSRNTIRKWVRAPEATQPEGSVPSLEFTETAQNVVFIVGPGTGKTLGQRLGRVRNYRL
jgi:transposase-like protein